MHRHLDNDSHRSGRNCEFTVSWISCKLIRFESRIVGDQLAYSMYCLGRTAMTILLDLIAIKESLQGMLSIPITRY